MTSRQSFNESPQFDPSTFHHSSNHQKSQTWSNSNESFCSSIQSPPDADLEEPGGVCQHSLHGVHGVLPQVQWVPYSLGEKNWSKIFTKPCQGTGETVQTTQVEPSSTVTTTQVSTLVSSLTTSLRCNFHRKNKKENILTLKYRILFPGLTSGWSCGASSLAWSWPSAASTCASPGL